MFAELYSLECSSTLSDHKAEGATINLSTTLEVIEKILKGQPVYIENLKFKDSKSKESVRKLLLRLI